jgi:hypothetical protein
MDMGKLLGTVLVATLCLAGRYPQLCAAPPVSEKLDPIALAARIDQRLEEKWQGIEPAPPADDAEFLRRVYLDLAGRIPRVQEVRDFLEDVSLDRRSRIVEELLESPRYVDHFSTTWLRLLIPSTENQLLGGPPISLRFWLNFQFRRNISYDQITRSILTAEVDNAAQNLLEDTLSNNGWSPRAFLLANERKPENLAASVSRIFLGVKLECAQCHDHPQARWTRTQFWETAAFFSAIELPQSDAAGPIVTNRSPLSAGALAIPGTNKVVQARFLTGAEPALDNQADPRIALAEWLTSRDNPYFARTAVNRIWAHFFGIGLIDPVDDEPTEDNPIRYPELLAELTQRFVAHNYDIKYLIRAITATRAYQRTSVQSHASQADLRAFARMPVRGLTPEQVFDSVALATGHREFAIQPNARQDVFGNLNTARGEFLNRFATQERATEKQTSILQALALMNGQFVADATSLDRSMTLAAVANAPFMSIEQKIETLYLATLSRLPKPSEMQRLTTYVSGGGSRGDARLALGDVFWALLNSSEFILNH